MKAIRTKVHFTIEGVKQPPVIVFATNPKGVKIIMRKRFKEFEITKTIKHDVSNSN
jgi:hypothetical protein